MTKQILIKVYTPDGTYIKTVPNARFDSFMKEINGGLGECVIEWGQNFGYTGSELLLGNVVEILISDEDTVTTPDGYARIYKGYISLIEPSSRGHKETILVHLLGFQTMLSLDILKDGVTTTINTDAADGVGTGAAADADIALVMRGIIDRYRAETVNPQINYDPADIPLIGSDMQFSFEQKTYREAMEKVKTTAPAYYFYYIDENGMLKFRQSAIEPTHSFYFGKHFLSVQVERSMEKIRNFLLIWDGQSGGIYEHYQDDNSIAQYGRRAERLTDFGIKTSATADAIGDKFITENKDPSVRVVCEVVDNNDDAVNGYDIESINPGDTCSFFNFDASLGDIFRENMIITQVVYTPGKATVTVEPFRSGLVDIQERTVRKLDEVFNSGIPATYS